MCWQFLLQSDVFVLVLLVPLPRSEQLSFSLRKCLIFRLVCGSQWCITAVIGFFSPERLCSCCAPLDEILVFEFLTKCLCSLSPGWNDGLVYTGTGQGTNKHLCETILGVRAGCVMPASCTGGERTCCSIVNPLLASHLSFFFVVVVHSSGMKPHFHYLTVHAQRQNFISF